jgi:serine/threonine protein phosphatase PrpC
MVRQEADPAVEPEEAGLRQPALLREREMTAPVEHGIGTGTAVVFSTKSPGKETANEDAALLVPVDERRCVLAVADGVGGHAGGAQAARLALRGVQRAVARAVEQGTPLREAILSGIEAAHAEVCELKVGAATTLALAELDGRELRTYHAGDSALLVVGQRGRIKLQTIDHSPVGYAVEAGVLDEREAIHHRDRHLISNALGTEGLRIDVGSPVTLAARDTLLIASDGLFDNLHTREIAERVRKGPLLAGVERLVSDCRERMAARDGQAPSKPDDLTVLAYRP